MTLRGSVAAFPLETIVQLLAATGKTGQLEVRADGDSGNLGFDKGRLVSAVIGEDQGDAALGAVFTMTGGEFEFMQWEDPPTSNLAGDLTALLDRAVVQRDRIIVDRQLIPDDGVRFALSGKAADQGEVRLTSSQWKVLLAVNGERDLREIAAYVGMGRLAMLSTMADLVRSGIVELREGPPKPPSRDPRPPEPEPPRTGGEDEVHAAPAVAEEPDEDAADADSRREQRLAAISGGLATERGAAWAPPVAAEPTETEPPGPIEDLAPPPAEAPAPVTPAEPAVPLVDTAQPGLSAGPLILPSSPAAETFAPPPVQEAPKKRGLFSGLFKKDAATETADATSTGVPSERVLTLGALANGLLDEYAKPDYGGKGRIDGRIANLLMRVDEQADPIDHAIPVDRDRLDLAALQRADVSDRQVAPYLALLVSQIYEDAERAFGKDKAKRGYRAAASAINGADALGSDLRLPKA